MLLNRWVLIHFSISQSENCWRTDTLKSLSFSFVPLKEKIWAPLVKRYKKISLLIPFRHARNNFKLSKQGQATRLSSSCVFSAITPQLQHYIVMLQALKTFKVLICLL